jgi:hypothetical protein
VDVEDRRLKTIRGCMLHAISAYAFHPTPRFPVSTNPAFEYGAPKLHSITCCSAINTMLYYINSIRGCIRRDCIVDNLLDWLIMKCGSTSCVQPDLRTVHRSTCLSIRLCVYLGSSTHRKRPSFFTGCTSALLTPRAN